MPERLSGDFLERIYLKEVSRELSAVEDVRERPLGGEKCMDLHA